MQKSPSEERLVSIDIVMLHVSCKVVLACGDPEILFSRGGEGSEEYPGLAYRAIYWKQLGPNGY